MPSFMEQPAVLAKLIAIQQLSSVDHKRSLVDGLPSPAKAVGDALCTGETGSLGPEERLAYDALVGSVAAQP